MWRFLLFPANLKAVSFRWFCLDVRVGKNVSRLQTVRGGQLRIVSAKSGPARRRVGESLRCFLRNSSRLVWCIAKIFEKRPLICHLQVVSYVQSLPTLLSNRTCVGNHVSDPSAIRQAKKESQHAPTHNKLRALIPTSRQRQWRRPLRSPLIISVLPIEAHSTYPPSNTDACPSGHNIHDRCRRGRPL